MSTSLHAREQRARRTVASNGYRLSKIRERSRWYRQYGPYMIIDDATNSIVDWGLTLEVVELTR